mmetsp:Transcript_20880/g.33304  ORF Transcript_20880/g.33304 Transcript_20880/m.33304 type:complete len:232 (+) Transcript_20880:1755-2450(+)
MADNDAAESEALKSDVEQQAIQPQADDVGGSGGAGSGAPASADQQQPAWNRQASVYMAQYGEKATKEQVACIATYALLIASAPAIAAVIIGSQYDEATSACKESKDGEPYLLDPQTYLYVAGGVQLGMSGIYFFTQIVAFLCFSETTWMNIKIFMSQGLCRCISACYPMWHLAWACIGIYIYSAEMSKECQQEDVGVMILAWCVIEFVGVCCMSCCIACWTMMAASIILSQ